MVLFVVGSNDLLSKWLVVPVTTVTRTLRVAAIVLPPLVGWITYRIMDGFRRSGAESRRDTAEGPSPE